MLKKYFFLSFILFSSLTQAETCPTPSDIKTGQFHNWKPFNCDSGEPVTHPHAIRQFQKNVHAFTMAEWMPDAPEGPAHCYYQNNQSDPLSIYLVKTTSAPKQDDPHWEHSSLDILHCKVSADRCYFQD